MWDEKQFFEEYKKESKQIQPDPDFTKRLKEAVKEEEVKKPKAPIVRIVAVAASFAICFGVGTAAWNGIHSAQDSQMEHSYMAGAANELQEMQDQETATVQEETDMVQENEEAAQEDTIDPVTPSSADPLTEAVDAMREGAEVSDKQGNIVSSEEQQELFELLGNVEICSEDISEKAEVKWYQLEGEKNITIVIYEENYIQIDGTIYKEK